MMTKGAFWIFVGWFLSATHGQFLSNSTNCSLAVFLPFTYNGYHEARSIGGMNSLGYSQMAAAYMAAYHWNRKDPVVVPELGDDIYQECDFLIDADSSLFIDTEQYTHHSTQELLRLMLERGEIPCAFAGPYSDLSSQVLGSFAAAAQKPLVSHRSQNLRATNQFFSPYSNSVYPDLLANTRALVSYMETIGRNNYTAIVYVTSDSALQQQEVISFFFDEANIQYRLYAVPVFGDDSVDVEALEQVEFDSPFLEISEVFQRVKNDGYRTIIMVVADVAAAFQVTLVEAAAKAGLTNGEYMWILPSIDISVFSIAPINLDPFYLEILVGGAIISPLEGFETTPEDSEFLAAWRNMTENDVALINSLHPLIDDGEERNSTVFLGEPDYFQKQDPLAGSGLIYDALISIGMGACEALRLSGDRISGQMHLAAIRNVSFTGATGRVKFEGASRDSRHVRFGVVNLFPKFAQVPQSEWPSMLENETFMNEVSNLYEVTDVLETAGTTIEEATWQTLVDFVFRDGRTVPPKLLRNPPNSNFLPKGTRIVGLTLMVIVQLSLASLTLWVFLHREHRIICASQPPFLFMILFGCFMSSWSIFLVSNDESYGWTTEMLDGACVSVPWLVTFGHILTYGALFSKLWRVNRVMQFRKGAVNVVHVLWPSALLFLASLGVLLGLTILDPLKWIREETNRLTGDSIAYCDSESFGLFYLIGFLMLVPMILTGMMAYKTLDVSSEYSESYWIFVMIVIQVEVVIFGLPMAAVTRDVSTVARYFSVVLLIFAPVVSVIIFLFGPKVFAVRRALSGTDNTSGGGRKGAAGVVHVTGISAPAPNTRPEVISALTSESHKESELESVETPRPPLASCISAMLPVGLRDAPPSSEVLEAQPSQNNHILHNTAYGDEEA